MDPRAFRVVSCLYLLGLWVVPTVYADQDFGETLDVEVVNVEVWVTDRNGEPVAGLPAEAFHIEEDGESMDLRFFDEVRRSRFDSNTSASEPMEGAGSAAPSDGPGGHMVIYFDETYLTVRGRTSLTDGLMKLLDSGSVDPDRVLILRQNEALYVEAPFGSDLSDLKAAIRKLGEPRQGFTAPEVERQSDLAFLQNQWRAAVDLVGNSPNPQNLDGHPACRFFLPAALGFVRGQADVSRRKINVSLEHLHAVAGFLSAIPGVKSLVYASDSLEMQPGSSLMAYVEGLCPGETAFSDNPTLSGQLDEAFRRLSRGAAANRVTFYGMQPSGLRVNVALAANNETVDLRSTTRYQSVLHTAERAGHSYLATETGGRTVFNTNDLLDDLQSIAEEMSSYYSLGYAPDHPGDGHEHTIRVRLQDEYDRRGLQVRHRRGYQHKAADTRLGERLQAALFMGLGENPMGVRLGAETPADADATRQRKRSFVIPLHVYVPVKAVTFVPGADAMSARVFVQVVWRDASGRKPEVRSKTWNINGPADENGLLDLALDLELTGGLSTVAVAVRDEASRETSYVSTTVALPVEAPSPAATQTVGSSPGR